MRDDGLLGAPLASRVASRQSRTALRGPFPSTAGRPGDDWWARVGIEPPASAVLQRRSTDELHARLVKTLVAGGRPRSCQYAWNNGLCPLLCVRGRTQRILARTVAATKTNKINYESHLRPDPVDARHAGRGLFEFQMGPGRSCPFCMDLRSIPLWDIPTPVVGAFSTFACRAVACPVSSTA